MSKGLKTIADELGTRIRFFKTETHPVQQGVMLEGIEIKKDGMLIGAVGFGKDMRAAAQDLARKIRSQTLIHTKNWGNPNRTEYQMPDEIDPRQYK